MAGRVKHMKRSHRSYGNAGYSVFRDFERHASSVAYAKQGKNKSLGFVEKAKALFGRSQGK